MAPQEDREVAALPVRAAAALKLPVLAPFDSPESIVQALASRETLVLTAGLLQVEKRGLALVGKAAPRAVADPLLDYLAKYPTVDGVFSAWDTAHKSNNSQLSTAVLSALSALIRLVSTDPFASEPEIIRRLLTQYGTHLDRALNPGRNDVTVAALKLCNVVVGFGSGRFARRLFGCMQWSPKIVTRLFKTRLRDTSRDPLLKPDIRTLLSMLVLAFLAAGDSRLKGEVIDTKGLVSGMVKGLSEDPDTVVNHVLVGLYRDVVADRSVGLESRRSIFDEPCIIELVKLYDVADNEENPSQSLRLSTHRFLYALTEWLATQINDSQTRSFGPQKVLGTVLRTLKVTEDSEQRELGLHILQRAPILAGLFWARFPSSLDPRLSSRWISAITFATLVLSLPVSPHLTLPLSPSPLTAPPSLASVLDTIFPPSLTKVWYSKALQHEAPLVSFLASLFILAGLQKATGVLEALAESSRRLEENPLTGRWAALAMRVREHCRITLPDPQIVVALMQKTAVGVPKVEPKKKSSRSKEKAVKMDVDKVEEAPAKEEKEDGGRHLRTNVALRLLWLYHRVVPSLISTLRFDFARLPQAHVAKSDAEGIRAISSAYALRLAAIHSSGLSWSRPGDHFKNTLLPLFQLYRTPSTPSNLHLLLSILSRLLQTPILFGTTPTEVAIWLSALPTPSQLASDPASTAVLDFFERSVQKTLTAPIKTTTEEVVESDFSPLLLTVLAGLKAELEAATEAEPFLAFVRQLVLGFIGQSVGMEGPKQVVAALGESFGKGKTTKDALKFLKDCVAAVEEAGEVAGDAEVLKGELAALSPKKANVFAAAGEDAALLEQSLNAMPVELVFLHVRPADLIDLSTSAILARILLKPGAGPVALQVLVHRYLGGAWSESDRQAFAAFMGSLVVDCGDERVQQRMKIVLVGEQGLLRAFAAADADTPVAGIAELVAKVLSPAVVADRALARPYCAVVVSEITPVKAKKSKKETAVVLSARIVASAPLLPFFDDETTLSFLDILLAKVPLGNLADLEAPTAALLDAALVRASHLSGSAAFRATWTTNFVRLHRLSTKGGLTSAGRILAQGAQALLPFVISDVPGEGAALPFAGFRHASSDLSWRQHASEWTAELLAEKTLGLDQSQVLATLIYRSAATREQFAAWVEARSNEGNASLDGAEAAIRALLEVGAVHKVDIAIPQTIAIYFTERLLVATAPSTSEPDLRRVVELMCSSPSTPAAVSTLLGERIPSIDRDSFTPTVLRLLSDLAILSPSFGEHLDLFVNSSFGGLVRRFAEDEEDTPAVLLLVQELHRVAAKHDGLSLKSHLLDPLITAAITRRLDKLEPVALAAALCREHQWKDNEVTRHLNNVFASAHFHPHPESDASGKKVQSAVVSLVFTLAKSSISAAASSKIVEKLMPFYGGTLSSDDKAIVDLFQRAELVAGGSISAAFRHWNSSLDQSPIEATRAGSLAVLQPGYVRRSWLRVCASTRTQFPKEHADITYDPHFLLSFLAHTIAEDELKAQDWINMLDSGVLGIAVAALASTAPSVRGTARSALASALVKLQPLSFREKDEIILVLTHARNCIFSSEGEPIPAVIALFLANCIAIMGTPESALYPAFSRFLLQRPVLDQRDVPMFYLLFYSTSEEPVEDHRWLLKFLAEGLVRTQDWKIYRRRQIYELLASLLQTSRQDPTTRKLVLQFLIRATSIPQAARELLSRNGLLGWLSAQTPVDVGERRLLISIISNVVAVLAQDGLAGAADALDALLAILGPNDVAAAEASSICLVVSTLAARLPTSPSSSAQRLVLDRARSILAFVAGRLSADSRVQADFYRAVLAVGFARHAGGWEESRVDKELFNAGISAALAAGVEEVRAATLRSLSD